MQTSILLIIAVIILTFLPTEAQNTPFGSIKSPPAGYSKSQLPLAKKYYDGLFSKNLPMSFQEAVYKQLEIKTPICIDHVMESRIQQCSAYRCFKKADVFGTNMMFEFIVSGTNKFGNCDIAFHDRRYFVPKEYLNKFYTVAYKSFSPVPEEMEGTVGIGSAEGKMTITHKINQDLCKITVISKGGELDLALSNLRPIRSNEKDKSTFSVNGITYVAEDENYETSLTFKEKLISAQLASDAPKSCVGLANLLYDLQKMGLTSKLVILKPKALELEN